jgi:ketosteroid isomerase-like protein
MKSTITMALAATLGAMTIPSSATGQPANPPAAAPAQMKLTDVQAAAAADAAQRAWTSMDAAKIDSVYASNIIGFDPVAPPLSTDRGNWTKLQQGFAAMKFNQLSIPDRKIQILDDNTFIVSGTAQFTSKDGPVKAMPMRFTDVYERQPDGKFLIVNEHVSQVPAAEPAKP